MTRIRNESVEAVKEAVDMIDLVSGRTQLKRSGVEWRGRCPFHDERTASFWVNPLTKLYHCFGCQASGDAIGFVRETEALDFAAAVEWLSERYGVALEYDETSPEADRRRAQRERLLKLLDDSATYYQRYLWEASEAAPARSYLEQRGITARAPTATGWATRRRPATGCGGPRWARASPPPSWTRPGSARAEVTGSGSGCCSRWRTRAGASAGSVRGRCRAAGRPST